MNILHLIPQMQVGGVETGLIDLNKYLTHHNHKSVVVSAGGYLVKLIQKNGGKHYQLPIDQKSILAILKTVFGLIKIIRQEKIEIIHAESWLPAISGFFAAKLTKKIFITTLNNHYKNFFKQFVIGFGEYVICPSHTTAEFFKSHFHLPNRKIEVIWRGVDLEKFKLINPQDKRGEIFRIGVIGRLAPRKGHLIFFEAIKKIVSETSNIKVWVVGDLNSVHRAYVKKLTDYVSEFGLEKQIEFLGLRYDISEIISQLDLLVLPTINYEPFGYVILEAQASGVPVVATDTGGPSEIIQNNFNGLLVPPNDPDAMAKAIVRLINDMPLSSVLAENAYHQVKQKFNLELMGEQTLKIYQAAVAKRTK